ncbi:MAG TPA: hypothetical protein VND98_04480 [Solirubrobacterales bacterium]|nr:hypothetical protein [Solirubrobacterales bacterium]
MDRSAVTEERPTLADSVAYWLIYPGIYLLTGFLWYYAFKEKIFDDGAAAPAPIKKEFAGSFIASFPGTSLAWGILGVAEGLVVLALIVSLVRREILPQRAKPWLLGALGFSMLIFAVLAFGQSMTSQFESVAQLYSYFAATAVIIVLVLLMPPYRPARWLSGLVQR